MEVIEGTRSSLIELIAKCYKLQAATALQDEEEDALFEIGEFGDSNSVSLQRTVWWLFSLHFGFRAKDESRKLRWAMCSSSKIKMAKKCLFGLLNKGLAMARKKDHRRAFQPRVYATKTERCPLKFYKTCKSHIPVEMNQLESPFYQLAVRQNRSSQGQVWNMRPPLGKNEINSYPRRPKKLVFTGRGNELPTIRLAKRVFPGYSTLIFQRTSLLNSVAT